MGITLSVLLPIGSVIHSMLSESQFQSQIGSGWVLADGRSATGTIYNTITGASAIPDMRDIFLRGKGNGRGINPDGDLALGTYAADKYLSHNHGGTYLDGDGGLGDNASNVAGSYSYGFSEGYNTGAASSVTYGVKANGGNETAPKSVTVNIFIRIN